MKSKSAVEQQNQVLHLIPQVRPYKQLQNPVLSAEKTVHIQQKLKLDKQANNNTKDRESNSDYYIKYNFNPFMEYQGRQNIAYQNFLRNTKQKVINVANKMADLKANGVALKPTVYEQSVNLKEIGLHFNKFSQKLLNKIQKQTVNKRFEKPIITTISPTKTSMKSPKKSPRKYKGYLKIDATEEKNLVKLTQNQFQLVLKQPTQFQLSKLQIEGIVNIKQTNYFFTQNKRKINIFKIARGDDDDISTRQILANMHFCHNAMIEKIAKMKIPIYRDISVFGRKIIRGEKMGKQNPIDFVDSFQISYKLKQLLFQDVMSVASNRFSSDFLNRMMNFEEGVVRETSDTASEQKDQMRVVFQKNQRNAENNFIDTNEQIQQMNDYKVLIYNKPEQKYQDKCMKKYNHVVSRLQLRKDLVSKTVNDQILHKEISTIVQKQLQNFVQMDQPISEADRLIRINKISKNKTEVIKMKTLLETLAYKNKHQQMLQQKQLTNKSKRKIKN